MESELKALLAKAGSDERVIAHVGDVKKCKSAAVLAAYPSSETDPQARATDVATKLLRDSEFKDDDIQIAMVSMAYRKAVASTERLLKRSSEGIPEEDLETPLGEEAHNDMMNSHLKAYGLTRICSQRILSDTLLGRIRREFESARITNLAVDRVKTLAHSLKVAPPKKHQMSERAYVTFYDDPEDVVEDGEIDDVHCWSFKLCVMGNSWGVAGSFKVKWVTPAAREFSPSPTPVERTYCHWCEQDAYVFKFTAKIPRLRRKYTEGSIRRYLTSCEHTFRAQAIELARGEERWPWGAALLRSLSDNASTWQEEHGLLVPLKRDRDNGGGGGGGGGGRASGGGGGGKRGGELGIKSELNDEDDTPASKRPRRDGPKKGGIGSEAKVKTSRSWNGSKLCEKFNSKNSCTNPQCQDTHRCDVTLLSGKACGGTHRRIRHDLAKDGQAQFY